LGAYLGWMAAIQIGTTTWSGFFLSLVVGGVVGGVFAALTELFLIRPLYERHIEQVLVTVGLALASVALYEGIWGSDPINIAGPAWLGQVTQIFGARVPNKVFIMIIAGLL